MQTVFWNRFAFLRLTVWFVIGIIIAFYSRGLYFFFFTLLSISLLSFFVLIAFLKSPNAENHTVKKGFLAFFFCVSMGYMLTYTQAEYHQSNHLLNIEYDSISAYKVILISRNKASAKSDGFESQITHVKIDSLWYNYQSRAMLYFQKEGRLDSLKYGDVLLINGTPSTVKEPKNPDEFDYKAYLALKQVYFQQYVKANQIYVFEESAGNLITNASYEAAHLFEVIIERHLDNPRSIAIAKALSIGIKDDLDNELKRSYASAGAMHVLAVSGLHVGIIFLLISFLFKRYMNSTKGRLLFVLLSLLGLWSYAFVTGLSPSVLRAATMFSFVAVGKGLNRHTNTYNTLAASAFILLLLNPMLLFSVGFQLSYLAVFGIVFFQPRINKLFVFKYAVFEKMWAITSVSIAAQLVTGPLSILYFNQFPTYFFISNLFVIPAAFIILSGSLLLILFSWWDSLAHVLGRFLDLLIQFNNYLIIKLESLPFSLLEGIYLTVFESWIFYLVLFFMSFFILYKQMRFFYVICCLFLLIAINTSFRFMRISRDNKMTVYAVDKEFAFTFRKGYQQQCIQTSTLRNGGEKANFHIQPSQLKLKGVRDVLDSNVSVYRQWNGLGIAVWNERKLIHVYQSIEKRLQKDNVIAFDFLLVSNNRLKEALILLNTFEIAFVIVDASNNYYQIRSLKNILEEKGIPYYIVSEKGAFEIKI